MSVRRPVPERLDLGPPLVVGLEEAVEVGLGRRERREFRVRGKFLQLGGERRRRVEQVEMKLPALAVPVGDR